MTTESDLAKASVRDQLGNIDQIREILFGSQLRSYGDRVEQIETRLAVLHQEVRDRTEEVRQVLLTQIHAAFEELERKVKSLGFKDSDEKIEIRQQIDRLNKYLVSNVDTLNEGIEERMNSLQVDFSATRQKLQEDVQTLRQQISGDLNHRVSALNQTKAAKIDTADMLFELGARLKKSAFSSRDAKTSPFSFSTNTISQPATPTEPDQARSGQQTLSEAEILQSLASLSNQAESAS